MHETNEYFYRFVSDISGPGYSELRSRLRGVDPGYHISDDTAESDGGLFGDDVAESAGRDKYVDYISKVQGLDTSNPWDAAKKRPSRFFKVGTEGLSKSEIRALNKIKEKVDSQYSDDTLAKYMGPQGVKELDAALYKYKYTGNAPLKTGINMTGHLDNVMALMKGAETDVFIGAYQIEHASVIDAIGSISQKLQTNVVLNHPKGLGLGTEVGAMYLQAKLGSALKMGRIGRWDHFKLYGINLGGEDITKAAFMLGSINTTYAALGKIDTARGSNMENSFTLDYSMVEQGKLERGVFNDLINQARAVRTWMESGTNKNWDLASITGSKSLSRLMVTGETGRTHFGLLQMAGATGGHIRIANFQVGLDYASALERAIISGASVEILHGLEHVDSKVAGKRTSGVEDVLNMIRSNLESRLGTEETARRFKTTKTQQFVHTKTAIYSMGGQDIMITGSSNLSSGMLRGYHSKGRFPSRTMGTLYTRDLDILLHGQEYDVAGEVARFDDIRYSSSLIGKSNYGPMDLSRLREAIANRSSRFDLSSKTRLDPYSSPMDLTEILDNSNRVVGGKVSIGGRYTLRDKTGKISHSINVGELVSLSVVNNSRGFSNQLYIPELGKFIGPVQGVGFADSMIQTPDWAVRSYDAEETIAAAVSTTNDFVSRVLSEFTGVYGAEFARDLRDSAYLRGFLRRETKKYLRENVLSNLAGEEPGYSVYNTKASARLAFGVSDTGLLSLDQNTKMMGGELRSLRVTPGDIEASLSAEFNRAHRELYPTKTSMLKFGMLPIFRSGGLSSLRPSRSAYDDNFSAARLFDIDGVVKSLPIAGKLFNDDYFFMMPLSKAIQLSQRLGNIMSARALGTEFATDMTADQSLLRGEDGKPITGVRLRAYMGLGWGGDIAYFDSARLGDSKFSDYYSKSVRLPSKMTDLYTLGTLKKQLEGLAESPRLAQRLDGNRYRITTAGLNKIGHKLDIAELIQPGTGRRMMQQLPLPTSRYEGAAPEMIIDLDKLTVNDNQVTIVGETLRSLQTGDRIMLGVKAPLMFTKSGSFLFDRLNRIGVGEAGTYQRDLARQMGFTKGAHMVVGSSSVKTGDALIQTGLEVIKTGLAGDLLNTSNVEALLSGQHSDFFDRMSGYLDEPTKKVLESIRRSGSSQANQVAQAKKLFKNTQKYLGKNGYVSMSANNSQHIAAAYLAFGLYSSEFMKTADFSSMKDMFGRSGMNYNMKGISTNELLGFVPLSFVSSISSSAVTMSSRDSVNFLNYHAGKYTDAFMDMMALDPRVQARSNSYTQLLSQGVLGYAPTSEYVVAGLHDSVMSHYQLDMHSEFIEMATLMRYKSGQSSNLTALKAYTGGTVRKQLRASEIASIQSQIEAKIVAKRGQSGITRMIEGGYDSSNIHSFLEAEKTAGIGSRTLLVPELGRVEAATGRFIFDITAARAGMRQVRLLSPDVLLSLGSFGDYSHEIQRKHVELVQMLPAMQQVFPGGKVGGPLSREHVETYTKFMDLVAGLESATREAAATDYQKMLGGQLSISGQNMIVGMHHELPEGIMVLGSQAYQKMKADTIQEIRSVFKAKYANPREGLYALVDSLANKGLLDAKAIGLLKQTDEARAEVRALEQQFNRMKGHNMASLSQRRLKVKTEMVQDLRALSDKTKQRLGVHNRIRASRLANIESLTIDLRNNRKSSKLREALGLAKEKTFFWMRQEKDEILIDRHRAKNLIKNTASAKLEILTGRAKTHLAIKSRNLGLDNKIAKLESLTLLRDTLFGGGDTNTILSSLFGSPELRSEFMVGMFQRAGAPIGPMAMTANQIYTVSEANKLFFKHAPMSEAHFKRSVLMGAGSMLFNFGDFDGDTASVARLSRFSALKVMDLIDNKMLSPTEKATLGAVKNQLNLSSQERAILFAKTVSADSALFSERNLYSVSQATKDAMGITRTDQARAYLHSLEDQAKQNRIKYKRKVDQARRAQDWARRPGSAARSDAYIFSLETQGMGKQAIQDLRSFRARKDYGYNLAIASVKFSADITGMRGEIMSAVKARVDAGMTERQAYEDFMSRKKLTSLEGFTSLMDLSKKQLKSVNSTLQDSKIKSGMMGDEGLALTQKDLVALFNAAAFSATMVIGKVFETSFSTNAYWSRQRAEAGAAVLRASKGLGLQGNIRDIVQTLTGMAGLPGNVTKALHKYNTQVDRHNRISGVVLLAQQMARDAIKPKIDTGALSLLRSEFRAGVSEVASGIGFVLGQQRTKAMHAFYQLVEGQNFFGEAVELTKSGIESLHNEMVKGFSSFYEDQVDALRMSGGTNTEFIDAVLAKDDNTKYQTMTAEDLHKVFADTTNEKLMAYLGKGDPAAGREYAISDEGRSYLETKASELANEKTRAAAAESLPSELLHAVIRDHLVRQGKNMADIAVYDSWNPSVMGYRRDQLNYLTAINSGTSDDLFNETSKITRKTKLQVFSQLASRGKMTNSANFREALMDLMLDYDTSNQIRSAAQAVSDSPMFADQMYKLHSDYMRRGTLDSTARYTTGISRYNLEALETEFGSRSPDDLVDLEKTEANIDTKRRLAEYQKHKMHQSFMEALGHPIKPTVVGAESVTASQIQEKIDKALNSKMAHGAIDAMTNALFPGLIGAAAFGAATGTSGAFGETFAASAAMLNPMVAAGSVAESSQDLGELGARVAVFGGAMAAGVGSSVAVNKLTENMFGKAIQSGASKLVSGGVAGVVGFGAAFVLEAMMHRFGAIKDHNPIPQAVAALTGLTEQFTEAISMGIPEDMETEAGLDITVEHQVFYEATGELLAVYHTDPGDGLEGDVEADTSEIATQVTYDQATESV